MQEEAEERFRAWEEEKRRKETELEDQRRRKERAHELQVLQLLTRSQLPTTQPRQQSMYSFGLHPDNPSSHSPSHSPYIMSISTSNIIINPRRACAARVTVLGSVCVSVCLCVC